MQIKLEISVQKNILPHIVLGRPDTRYIDQKSVIYPVLLSMVISGYFDEPQMPITKQQREDF